MAKVNPIPQGSEAPIPHLVVDDAARAIDFYVKAFGAQEKFRLAMPDGRISHAELRLGSSVIYLADDYPEMNGGARRSPRALKGTPITIHRYVEDTDAAVRRASEAGAKVKMPATEMFWGDRYGVVEDPFGHLWAFATHVKDLGPEEIKRAANEHYAKRKSEPAAK